MLNFSDTQLERYARNILLPEVGGSGQQKLRTARVLIVGAGGLGAPMLAYLAAAGVGTATDTNGVGEIGIVDDDTVALTNLQRQIIYREDAVDTPKVEQAQKFAKGLNSESRIAPIHMRLDTDTATELVSHYDIVADASDNFSTRYLLNAACFQTRTPLVSAALLRFDGQISLFRGYLPTSPCYCCLFPKAPQEGAVPSCSAAGILGSVAGTLATLQATEIIKTVLNIGRPLDGTLLIYSGLDAEFRRISIPKNPNCSCCGA